MLVQKYPMNNVTEFITESSISHKRRAINGKMTDSAHCTGYCSCNEHNGYLTDKLVNKHKCHKKQCTHFFSINKNVSYTVAY